MTLLRVYRLSQAEEDWICDRGVIRNYANDPREARRRMGKLFSASCAALSCTNLLNDSKTTRLVDASVPSLSSLPIRLVFELPNASADMSWNEHRPVDVRDAYAPCDPPYDDILSRAYAEPNRPFWTAPAAGSPRVRVRPFGAASNRH
ncbi:hypothetical protein Q1695_003685 [Nippostrongylus brasiliensis]|nr:hypothetical protein Q1695_003685 [Nippostrongylus brasiliensis]